MQFESENSLLKKTIRILLTIHVVHCLLGFIAFYQTKYNLVGDFIPIILIFKITYPYILFSAISFLFLLPALISFFYQKKRVLSFFPV